jgi:hypothetical protein
MVARLCLGAPMKVGVCSSKGRVTANTNHFCILLHRSSGLVVLDSGVLQIGDTSMTNDGSKIPGP